MHSGSYRGQAGNIWQATENRIDGKSYRLNILGAGPCASDPRMMSAAADGRQVKRPRRLADL